MKRAFLYSFVLLFASMVMACGGKGTKSEKVDNSEGDTTKASTVYVTR